MNNVKNDYSTTPILFPVDPEQLLDSIRILVREEVAKLEKQGPATGRKMENEFETPGLTYKPLYKITEVCRLFQITRPTIYDWVKHGKLRPYKIRSRVYFLWNDIQKLISAE